MTLALLMGSSASADILRCNAHAVLHGSPERQLRIDLVLPEEDAYDKELAAIDRKGESTPLSVVKDAAFWTDSNLRKALGSIEIRKPKVHFPGNYTSLGSRTRPFAMVKRECLHWVSSRHGGTSRHVRFTPDSGHSSVQVGCPLSARSRRPSPSSLNSEKSNVAPFYISALAEAGRRL
jgi:hypothetical protein